MVNPIFKTDANLAGNNKHVAGILGGAGVQVARTDKLNAQQMRDYAGFLSGLWAVSRGEDVSFLEGQVSTPIMSRLRGIAEGSGKVGGAHGDEIEVKVKVDLSLFETFNDDYSNRVLYKKAIRVELVRKIVDILL